MYAAKHYVKVDGEMYRPGEILPEDMPEETVRRFLDLKAIEKVPGAPDPVFVRNAAAAAEPEPPAGPSQDAEDETTNAEDEYDAAEPEEIDVTAGLVTEPAPEEKPKRSRSTGGRARK